ncbi:MAG: hypothetical protein WC069_06565 [Candidatus Shapirobacteria bacterium]
MNRSEKIAILKNSVKVCAKRDIHDSPCSKVDGGAKRGEVGWIQDYDQCAELFFVDFGSGAIACEPDELL